jgi:hypothetical protein
MTMRSAFCAKRVAGRIVDGQERDGGKVRHAVLRDATVGRAICAFVPAQRSGGWVVDAEHAELADVTCRGCLVTLARQFPQRVGER